MTSFLTNCPECGSTIAKGAACPGCRWTENADETATTDCNTVAQFAVREKHHRRNYAIFMMLSFVTGLIGLLTAFMWVLAIYRGNILAFVFIALFTVLTGILSGVLYFSNRIFPIDLNCPSCELRLDKLGTIDPQCPSCGAQLKLEHELARV